MPALKIEETELKLSGIVVVCIAGMEDLDDNCDFPCDQMLVFPIFDFSDNCLVGTDAANGEEVLV